MCRSLSKIPHISLYLYSPAPICADLPLDFERVIVRTCGWENGLLRQLWSESYLPMWAKTDEVDVFWGPGHRLPRWLSGNIARVVTIHDLVWIYAAGTMRPLSRILESFQVPFGVNTADEIVADSQATADALITELSACSDKLTVIPLGSPQTVNSSSFEELKVVGINRPYFLFVGTQEPRKNLIRLLIAFSRLSGSLKDQIMFVIAGGKGWGGVKISSTVAELGLTNNVLVLGYVEESTLSSLYANAQFLTMPSLYEGFGLPLVEAMVYGTPVLTSNNSSMPEVAGDAGLLIDAEDIDSIKSGLIEMISNPDVLDKLANNAKTNAARFNWDDSAQQLVSVFEKAIIGRASI
ncbi:MAG: glycosyltransferase family 4 protein [Candidatus Polarisedimenticolaceae bacterium]|nr:glycosyltransferase family 4 protein [Candidatus Polarisedimenticolaceae bacterium]